MRKMTKLIAEVLLACMLAGLCGCGSGEQTAAETAAPTPSAAPTPEPTPDMSDVGKLAISELMIKNRGVLADADGEFPDWIELENVSGESVSLNGWTVSDSESKTGWALPPLELAPGERLVIFTSGKDRSGEELHADFSLSEGETVCLFTPSGQLSGSVLCAGNKADVSLVLGDDGEYALCRYATPGYENSEEGYEAFCRASVRGGPLAINEVMVSNRSYAAQPMEDCCDWAEIKNVSEEEILLSDYWVSDDEDNYLLCQLPGQTLAPGETIILYCSGDEGLTRNGYFNTNFAFDANNDRLYLCTADRLVDYVSLHDVPVNGSCGRVEGENGFFYFTTPTPGYDNGTGFRRVSEKPEALTADGIYNDVENVAVELEAEGRIYYTTDGTVPTAGSTEYTGPVLLDKTTIVRAIAVEEGAAPSRVLTLSYIVNENHEIPVLSLVSDDLSAFEAMYRSGYVKERIPGVLSLYELDGSGFTNAGGIGLAGAGTRTKYPKKSISVKFSGKYGDGHLDYDIYDTGITEYDAVNLHAGEDYLFTVVRTGMFQNLAMELGDDVIVQHSKFCALYVNGEYYGLFCLKEKFTEQFYASLKGVSEESVTVLKYPVELDSDFNLDVIKFCRENDMSLPENYEYFCKEVNVDSLIDWFLLEGLAGNSDIGGNLRVMRTTEGEDTRWHFVLYDLDWSLRNSEAVFYNFLTNNDYHTGQIYAILGALFENDEFRDRLLTRYAEVWDTTLSNDNFIAMLDSMAEVIAPEMPRERALWGNDVALWESNLEMVRDYIRDNDLQTLGVKHLCSILGVSDEERAQYFGW